MGFAILGFLISSVWLITGWHYFAEENDENFSSHFKWRVAAPGVPVFLASVAGIIYFY